MNSLFARLCYASRSSLFHSSKRYSPRGRVPQDFYGINNSLENLDDNEEFSSGKASGFDQSGDDFTNTSRRSINERRVSRDLDDFDEPRRQSRKFNDGYEQNRPVKSDYNDNRFSTSEYRNYPNSEKFTRDRNDGNRFMNRGFRNSNDWFSNRDRFQNNYTNEGFDRRNQLGRTAQFDSRNQFDKKYERRSDRQFDESDRHYRHNSYDSRNRIGKEQPSWMGQPNVSAETSKTQNYDQKGFKTRMFKEQLQHVELDDNPFNVTPENRFDVLNHFLCPLSTWSSNNQLNFVQQESRRVLTNLTNKLRNARVEIYPDERGLLCPLLYPTTSSQQVAFRNKDEFSVWPGVDGNRKTVGFIAGNPRKHSAVCVEPDELVICKESHKVLAKHFQDYLRNISPLDTCTDLKGDGNWGKFIVKSNEEGEHLLIASMNPQQLSFDEIAAEKENLKNYFKPLADEHKIKSFYFQTFQGIALSEETSPFELLFGEESIQQKLNDFTFSIFPDTFFPPNKSAAELMSKAIIDELQLSKDMTVIELGCGIGTRSLQIASQVQRVIGVDFSKASVDQALKNAEQNGIKNCTFINGFSEEVLPKFAEDLADKNVTLLLSTGGKALPVKSITALRSMEFIRRIVYVSFKPEGKAVKNFFLLMLPEEKREGLVGSRFVAVNAMPFYSFPQTKHYELIVTFDRVVN